MKYVLGFMPLSPLVKQVKPLVKETHMRFRRQKHPVKIFTETLYKAKSWGTSRRGSLLKSNTTLWDRTPGLSSPTWSIGTAGSSIKQSTVAGGAMELMIKEHKNHLLSDRTSCTSFSANQFRLFLHSAAYVLLHTFRALYLNGSEWASAQFDTIRLKIIKIGARVIQLSRKIRIHLPTSFPWKGELQKIWLSCRAAGET